MGGMKCPLVALLLIAAYGWCPAFAFSADPSQSHPTPIDQQRPTAPQPDATAAAAITTSFSLAIQADSQKVEETWQAKLDRLWNDPRPFTEAFDADAGEAGDDGVSDELVDRSAMLMGQIRDLREVLVEQPPDGLGAQALGQRGEPYDVCEHHGENASLRWRIQSKIPGRRALHQGRRQVSI